VIKVLTGGLNIVASVYTDKKVSIIDPDAKLEFGDLSLEIGGSLIKFNKYRNLLNFLLPDPLANEHWLYKKY